MKKNGILGFIALLSSPILYAENTALAFKAAGLPKQGVYNYIFALLGLLAILLFLAKKKKTWINPQSSCQVIDKVRLSPKTTLYVLEYKKQRFMLGDNQQALTLIALPKGETHDQE